MALYDEQEEVALRGSMQPPGKRLGTVYEFEDGRGPGLMTPLVFARSLQAAQASEAKAKKDGGLPDPAPPPGPPKAASGKGVSKVKLPKPPDGKQWRCVGPPGVSRIDVAFAEESITGYVFGESAFVRHDGEDLVLVLTSKKDDDEAADAPGAEELDARVLGIQTVEGLRTRQFRSVVLEMSETDWDSDGWPVKGPRTCRWLCRFIAENSLHPFAHAARFRQLAGLSASDAGAQEHERAMRILEAALTFDQVRPASSPRSSSWRGPRS